MALQSPLRSCQKCPAPRTCRCCDRPGALPDHLARETDSGDARVIRSIHSNFDHPSFRRACSDGCHDVSRQIRPDRFSQSGQLGIPLHLSDPPFSRAGCVVHVDFTGCKLVLWGNLKNDAPGGSGRSGSYQFHSWSAEGAPEGARGRITHPCLCLRPQAKDRRVRF